MDDDGFKWKELEGIPLGKRARTVSEMNSHQTAAASSRRQQQLAHMMLKRMQEMNETRSRIDVAGEMCSHELPSERQQASIGNTPSTLVTTPTTTSLLTTPSTSILNQASQYHPTMTVGLSGFEPRSDVGQSANGSQSSLESLPDISNLHANSFGRGDQVVSPTSYNASSHDGTTDDLAELVEQFIQNRSRRQETVDAHLDEAQQTLEQGDPVRFAMWTLDTESSFYKDSRVPPHVQLELGKVISLTKDQSAKIAAHREAIGENRTKFARIREHLQRARDEISEHIRSSSALTDELRQILTPEQVAKFFVWVEQNKDDLLSFMDQECLETIPKTAGTAHYQG